MAKQRYINTKFWSDTYIADLDPLEKLLFLYLITNSYTNICGIYEIPLKQIALDTGIDRENIEKALLPRFKNAGKIYYIDGWIYVKNFAKHQKVNDSIKTGIKLAISEIPNEILEKIREIDRLGTDWVQTATYLNLNLNNNIHSETSSLTAKNKQRNDEFLFLIRKYKEGYASAIGGELTPFSFGVARKKFNEALKLGYKAADLENYLPLFFESKFYEKTNWSIRSFLSEGTLGILKKEYE